MPAKKGNKTKLISPKPKNVWHALRKLENQLNKAHIQSGIFLNELGRLRDEMSFEIRKEIVQKLTNSIHGDLLQALCARAQQLEAGTGRSDVAGNVVLLGLHETLLNELKITPFHAEGEKLTIRVAIAQEYDFEVHPSALDSNQAGKLSIEVLSCGWKVDGKVVVKPKVMDATLPTV